MTKGISSVQFSSVTQSCPILCNPMNHSTAGLPVHHQILEFTQTHVHRWGYPAISSSVIPFSSCPQTLTASGSFPMSQLFTWSGQRHFLEPVNLPVISYTFLEILRIRSLKMILKSWLADSKSLKCHIFISYYFLPCIFLRLWYEK